MTAWTAGFLAGISTPIGLTLGVLAVLAGLQLTARLRTSSAWCDICEWQVVATDAPLPRLASTAWHDLATRRRRWHREGWRVSRWRPEVHADPNRGETVHVDCSEPGCADRADRRSGWDFVDRDIAERMAKRHDRVVHAGAPRATVDRQLVGS